MLIKFTDWEVEKTNIEDFQGYDHRFYIEEVIEQNENGKAQVRLIATVNTFRELVDILKNIFFNNIDIKFVFNESFKTLAVSAIRALVAD